METLPPANPGSPLDGSNRATLYVQLGVTAALLFFAGLFFRRERLHPALPVVFLEQEKDFKKAKQAWVARAADVIDYGLKQFRKPFQVISSNGPKIILPNRYANEIKNDPRLSFGDWTAQEFLAHLNGFEGFGKIFETPIFVETIRTKLTQAIGNLTDDLGAECEATLLEKLGEPKEWTEITLKPFILSLVARLSTRVFIGPDYCRNEEWLDLIINYTVEAFTSARELRNYPAFLRPIANLYLPGSRRVRATVAHARAILEPEIERRRRHYAELEAQGVQFKGKDTMRWMDEVAKGRDYDAVLNQLFFSVAAMHTTSDLITQAMLDLVTHPDLIDELRQEVQTVLKEDGWKKTSLYKMKLMDSFLKESQRLSPGSSLVMSRVAREPVTLSDGTLIPKGAAVSCSTENYMDSSIYAEPEKFKPDRFLRLREQPGQEHSWQFVTTSEHHLGFGHGTHACPGRFFASNEAKIALSYMLLMYDWKLPDGVTERPQTLTSSSENIANPWAKVLFRRTAEIVPR